MGSKNSEPTNSWRAVGAKKFEPKSQYYRTPTGDAAGAGKKAKITIVQAAVLQARGKSSLNHNRAGPQKNLEIQKTFI